MFNACQKINSDKLYNEWKNGGSFSKLENVYPQNNTIFPPEIAPPTIMWHEPGVRCDSWMVVIEVGGKKVISSDIVHDTKWAPDKFDWEKIKAEAKDKKTKIIILGTNTESPEKLLAAGNVSFTISRDSVDAPIFFRTVTIPFKYAVENPETISWRLGNISSVKHADIILEKMQVCANCHSFSSDGKVMGMDVDYANDKGSYAVTGVSPEIALSIDKIITWSDYKREDGRKTYGLLSSVSPDGKYVVSTVKDRSIFVPRDDAYYSQLFFPIKGILAIYDREKKRYYSLPGADNPEYVQSNPTWSQDGKYICFTRAKAYTSVEAEKSNRAILPVSVAKEFIDGKRSFFYDIYKIPFNGGKGGKPEILTGASENNMSNFFARYSPDGKWIVFTQAKNFMLLQPDSKLYIMPAQGGQPRLMNCNTNQMNSWHSFSPNSKWLVFSSKFRGAYTKLYLTHIDENGIDSPPVCLEYLNPLDLAANIPEFINIKPNQKLQITEKFMNSDYYAEARVNGKAKSGDLIGAIKELTTAINSHPSNYLLYYDRAILEKKLGNMKTAMDDLNKSITINSQIAQTYYERAYLKVEVEDYKGAIEDLNKSLKIKPDYILSIYEMAVAKYYLKDFYGSIEICNKAIDIKPNMGQAYFQRALNNIKLDKLDIICNDLTLAIQNGCREAEQVQDDYCRDR